MRVCVLLPALLAALLLLEPGLAGPLPEHSLDDSQEEYGCNMPLVRLCNYPELEQKCDRKEKCDYIRDEYVAIPPYQEYDDASMVIEMYE